MHSEWRMTVLTLPNFLFSTSIKLSGLPISTLVCAEVPKCLWLPSLRIRLLFYYFIITIIRSQLCSFSSSSRCFPTTTDINGLYRGGYHLKHRGSRSFSPLFYFIAHIPQTIWWTQMGFYFEKSKGPRTKSILLIKAGKIEYVWAELTSVAVLTHAF